MARLATPGPDDYERALTDIEARIVDWLAPGGWSEEGAGLQMVQDWIKELRSQRNP